MTRGRTPGSRLCGFAILLLSALACAAPPAPQLAWTPVDERLRELLPPPTAALGLDPDSQLDELHRRLLAGDSPAAVVQEATAIIQQSGGSPASALLLAEARIVGGRPVQALETLSGLPPESRSSAGVLLVQALAHEQAGDPVEAYAQLRRISASDATAARRLAELEPAAIAGQRRRVQDALARGHHQDASREMATLELWRPRERETRQLAVEVAAAEGDRAAERAALLALAAFDELSRSQELRLARLDLELGDSAGAIGRLEGLARTDPSDPGVHEALVEARFAWRLEHSPVEVRAAARSAQLSRAELARMLYWLVPGVRAARGGSARIASDLSGHPAREEIIRVINLGVLAVDETVHAFGPDRPARRGDAMGAVLRAFAVGGVAAPCLAAVDPDAGEGACAAAVACGWIAEAGECLPGAAVSGAEVAAWIRRVGGEGP